MAFNALKYVDSLKEGGFSEEQAKAQVLVLQDFRDSEVATKQDLREMELRLKISLLLGIPAITGGLMAMLLGITKIF